MIFIALLIACALCCACTTTSSTCSNTTIEAESSTSRISPDSRIRGIYRQYDENAVVTPAKAPNGYKAVYISHYGRHGARYVETAGGYDKLLQPLQKAAAEGNLTAAGDSLLQEFLPICKAADHRTGELTRLGQTQHRGIATRMYNLYRPLFAGGATVEARSSNLERTMLSMFAFCNTLQSLSPSIKINADASASEIHTINPHSVDSKYITAYDLKCRHRSFYNDFIEWGRSNIKPDVFMQRIFKDVEKSGIPDAGRLDFMNSVFTIACAAGGMDIPHADFFRYLTDSELLTLAQWDNMFYYKAKGPGHRECGRTWAVSKYMLEDFIFKADEDMEKGVAARLRFGHDGCIMALFRLMDIDGFNIEAGNLDQVWDVWDISRVPMAANIQIAFWKNSSGDILIQPRYNERPLKLPIEEYAPEFYSWTAFKAHYLAVVKQASEFLDKTSSLE